MSLINKMLQDLDARGSQPGAAQPGDIRPVMVAERRMPMAPVALAAALLVGAVGAGAYYWLKVRAPGPLAKGPAVLAAATPVVAPAAPAGDRTVVLNNMSDTPVTPAMLPPAPAAVAAPVAPPRAAPRAAAAEPAAPPAPAPAVRTVREQAPAVREQAPAVRVVESNRLHEALSTAPRTVSNVAAPLAGGRDMNDAQRAERFYRQSLAALDDGRVAAAMDGMEQALKLNARHDAARQTLVGLLIEAGRKDEAMQQLEQGLAADASQAPMAMLLARMQIERGMSGVATLQRTLPSVHNNGEYRAFLAGALQREQRHREAAEQYAAALRTSPEQGVWLMGMGISLQAEKRDAEALGAFQRAQLSGMLTPALMAFVQGRIQQLQAQ